jgi:hypothetical protein
VNEAILPSNPKDATVSLSAFVSTDEEMSSVKAACAIAPPGPKKDAARVALRRAEEAHSAHQEADCLVALADAKRVLAEKG